MQLRDNIIVYHVKIYQPIYIIVKKYRPKYGIISIKTNPDCEFISTKFCTSWACAAYALTLQVFTQPFIWKTASSPIIMFERNRAGLPNNQLQWSMLAWRSLCSKAWHRCIWYGWYFRSCFVILLKDALLMWGRLFLRAFTCPFWAISWHTAAIFCGVRTVLGCPEFPVFLFSLVPWV